ncbi:MAG: ferredoxin [Gammaproteobacteria bacterium]
MKVIIDKAKCQGHAMCCFNSPDIYKLDDDGYNRMDPFEVKPGEENAARRGAMSCPEGAITIVEK